MSHRWAGLADRFWSKVDRSGGPDACWFWKAGVNNWGYGYFRIGKRMERAHRVAFVLGDPLAVERPGGPVPPRDIPDGLYVLHGCDIRGCCNPKCLRAGTQADNVKDEYARFRRPPRELTLAFLAMAS